MFKSSRDKEERAHKAASKSFHETFLASGDFICWGIEGYYCINKVSANSGNRVTVSVAYCYSHLSSWGERAKFQEEAKRLIAREYREYTIERFDFNNRW